MGAINFANPATGGTSGVIGQTDYGGIGVIGADLANGTGVSGQVSGSSSGGIGVFGNDISSGGGYGVYGTSLHGKGIYAVGSTYGVYATAASGKGVYGASTSGYGVYGTSSTATAVRGESSVDGTDGVSSGTYNSGVSGWNSGYGNGVWGGSQHGVGVYAQANGASYGVFSTAGSGGLGVYGSSSGTYSTGVEGYATGANTIGVYAVNGGSGSGSYGVYATCSGTNSSCTSIYANGNIQYTGTITQVSDERLKRDIVGLNGTASLDKLMQLRSVSYFWKDPAKHGGTTQIQRGFIAQEYEKVFPEWVTVDAEGYKGIQTNGLHALEVESIRTLKTENDDLKKRIEALEAGRRPLVSGNAAWGWMMGLALAGAFVVATRRKKKSEE